MGRQRDEPFPWEKMNAPVRDQGTSPAWTKVAKALSRSRSLRLQKEEWLPDRSCCGLHVLSLRLSVETVRVLRAWRSLSAWERADAAVPVVSPQFAAEKLRPYVANRPVEACHEAVPDGVASGRENDRYRRGCGLSGKGRKLFPMITAAGRRTNSATRAGRRSGRSSAERNSIATFWPWTKPASFRPWRNAVTRCVALASDVLRRNPTTGIAGCCRCAASGHATAEPAVSLMKSRRRIAFPGSAPRHVRLST